VDGAEGDSVPKRRQTRENRYTLQRCGAKTLKADNAEGIRVSRLFPPHREESSCVDGV